MLIYGKLVLEGGMVLSVVQSILILYHKTYATTFISGTLDRSTIPIHQQRVTELRIPAPRRPAPQTRNWSGKSKRGRCHLWKRESLSFICSEVFASSKLNRRRLG
jgi:hypothetical protein